jgi:hypothetical protein
MVIKRQQEINKAFYLKFKDDEELKSLMEESGEELNDSCISLEELIDFQDDINLTYNAFKDNPDNYLTELRGWLISFLDPS